jgi:hypothetical protein
MRTPPAEGRHQLPSPFLPFSSLDAGLTRISLDIAVLFISRLFHLVEIQTPFTFFQLLLGRSLSLFTVCCWGRRRDSTSSTPSSSHLPVSAVNFFVFIAVIKIVLCQAPAAESPAAESPDGRIRLSRPIPMNEKFWKFLFHFDIDKRI